MCPQAGAELKHVALFSSAAGRPASMVDVAARAEELAKQVLCADAAALYMLDAPSKRMVALTQAGATGRLEHFGVRESSAAWTVVRARPWRSVRHSARYCCCGFQDPARHALCTCTKATEPRMTVIHIAATRSKWLRNVCRGQTLH